MVAGRWLMRDRKMLTMDVEKTVSDAVAIANKFKSEMQKIDAAH